MSIQRRLGAAERKMKARGSVPAGMRANCYEPGDRSKLCYYDHVTDTVILLPPDAPCELSMGFDWQELRRFLARPDTVQPTIRRLGEEGSDVE